MSTTTAAAAAAAAAAATPQQRSPSAASAASPAPSSVAKALFAAAPEAADAALSDEHSAHFTYTFLRGLDTTSPNRPRKVAIPARDLAAMGNMERQFWEIKKEHFDVVIFFKKGKFYELYDCDAVISAREFGLKLTADSTNRGKMRMTGVPEQSFAEWARLFVFKGYKVGRVEQMEPDAPEAAGGGSGGALASPKQKVVPRHLVQILTKGTVADPAMLAAHDAYFVVAFAVLRRADAFFVDAVAVDVTRNIFYHCPCDAPTWGDCLAAVAALLLHLSPKEAVLRDDSDGGGGDDTPGAGGVVPRFEELRAALGSFESSTAAVGSDGGGGGGVSVELVRPPPPLHARDAAATLQAYFSYLKLTTYDFSSALAEADDTAARRGSQLRCSTYRAHLPGPAAPDVATTAAASTEVPPPPPQQQQPPQFMELESRNIGGGLVLDAATIENLELTANLRDGSAAGTLLRRLCHCATGGGRRLFRKWLLRPLTCAALIEARQDAVAAILATNLLDEWKERGSGSGSGESGGGSPRTPSGVKRGRATREEQEQNDGEDGGDDGSPAAASARSEAPPRTASGVREGPAFPHLWTVDLERSLAALSAIEREDTRISYVDPLVAYDKNLALILNTLNAFSEAAQWAAGIRRALLEEEKRRGGEVAAPLLEELLDAIARVQPLVEEINGLFDAARAAQERRVVPRPGAVPAYDTAVATLAALENRFAAHLEQYRRTHFGGDRKVAFCDIGKDLFLVEVPITFAKIVQQSLPQLQERTRTTKTIKYIDTSLAANVESFRKADNAKATALVGALRALAAAFSRHFAHFFTAAQAFAYVDCLMSLARSAEAPGCCRPTVLDAAGAAPSVAARDVVHPLLIPHHGGPHDALPVVPNSVTLGGAGGGAVLLLTGPNMAGKSTLMRSVAVAVIMAQLGGFVCASSMTVVGPVDRIFTRIGARDVTHRGMSTLFVELTECAAICRHATSRSLCLVDELGRGTSTHDGFAIAHAALMHLAGRLADDSRSDALPASSASTPPQPLTIFSTHYHALAHAVRHTRCERQRAAIQLGFMDFAVSLSQQAPQQQEEEAEQEEEGVAVKSEPRNLPRPSSSSSSTPSTSTPAASGPINSVTFLYRLVPGICSRSYGVEVAVKAGIPLPTVQHAQRRSQLLAAATTRRLLLGLVHRVASADDVQLRDPAMHAKLAAESAAVVHDAEASA